MFPIGIKRVKAWPDQYTTYPTSASVNADLSGFKYIGLHSKGYIMAISLDIDINGWAPEDSNIPMPNWVTTNPQSGHCHAVWFFDGLVDKANIHQSSYLAAISGALAASISKTNATVRNQNATQNPLHKHWRTRAIHSARYSLGFLAEATGVARAEKDFSHSDFRAQGRNCALYYDTIRMAQRNNWSSQQITQFATAHNHVIGTEFLTGPLPEGEVKSITSSVCRSAEKGYPYMKRAHAATAKRKRCNPNSVSARAKALGMSRSTFYAKRLQTLGAAVKHALQHPSDTTTGLDALPPTSVTALTPESLTKGLARCLRGPGICGRHYSNSEPLQRGCKSCAPLELTAELKKSAS